MPFEPILTLLELLLTMKKTKIKSLKLNAVAMIGCSIRKKFFFLLSLFLASIVLAQTGAKLIIICPDSYLSAVQPLADWKTKKGIKTIIAPLSVTGSSSSQIKNYILNAYNNWQIRPEYILLVGNGSLVPASGSSDDYYANMDVNYRIELSIGRLFCTSLDQCNTQIAKILGYERNPFLEDSTWFRKGTTIVREDNPPDQYYQADCRYIRNIWLNAGFMVTDSFLSTQGHNSTNVMNAINNGRTFVVYRGQAVTNWWSPFNNVDPNATTNGYKLPVVVSGTCATMSLTSTGYQGDRFVTAGTAQNPKGAIAYFGTTNTGSAISVYRSAVTRGFFRAIFENKIYYLGDAAKRAKFYMDSMMPSQARYQEWNLFGDPTLCLWTTTPKRNIVIFDSVVPQSANNFTVTVRDHLGLPVRDITVCIRMDTTIYAVGLTNSQGQVVLPIQPRWAGFMEVTVTGQDFIPYEGRARIIPHNIPLLTYQYSLINDTVTGNGNGRINPNEIIQLKVFINNSGAIAVQNLLAILRTTDPNITITDSIKTFDSIPINTTVANNGYYQFAVNQACFHNYQLNFQLFVQDNQGNNWNLPFTLSVSAGKLNYISTTLIDTFPGGNYNARLGRKESALLKIQIENVAENLYAVNAIMRSTSPYVIVTDSTASFGNIGNGSVSMNHNDPFAVCAAPDLPINFPISFKVLLKANGVGFTYNDSFTFTITSEAGSTQDPTGPDLFGYWAYDNTDTLSGRAPVYNWFEIGPSGPGTIIPEITNHDAQVTTLRLPFTFRYYGQNYDSISVCSNGFLAMGRTSYRFGNNLSGIPDTAGPPAMIAPFWCDLDPSLQGDIYQYYDAVNHRWIVEFYDVALNGLANMRQTFQVILYNPQFYPTPTGDGEIVFQYQTVALPSNVVVGIENQTETVGIQYLFNNIYHETAAPLSSNRAIKFSTHQPTYQQSPWVVLTRRITRDSIGGNNNGICEPNERIELVTYLKNFGAFPAENVNATLKSLDSEAVLTDSFKSFGNIPAQGEVHNQNNPFVFYVVPNPQDTILDFLLTVRAQNYSNTIYFSIDIRHAMAIEQILLPTYIPSLYLNQNTPNPFRNTCKINYAVPSAQKIELKIYNNSGRLVRTLVSQEQPAGEYQIIWDGKDEKNVRVAQGVYFYTLTGKTFNPITKKLIVQ